MAPGTAISSLPADVLSSVVRHLGQDDFAALRSVCRSLRLALDITATQATFHTNVDAAGLRSTIRRCAGLHTVRLQQLHPEAASATLETLAAMQHLRSLDMPMFEGMQLGDWTQLSGLTHLALRQIKEGHHGTLVAVLPRMTALRSLVLGSAKFCPCLPAAGVQRFASLSRLTQLDLGHAAGVAALAPQLPNLQSLALRLSYPDPQEQIALREELAALNSLTGLRRLLLAADTNDVRLDFLQLGDNVMVSLHHTPSNVCEHAPQHGVWSPLRGIRQLAELRAEGVLWSHPVRFFRRTEGGTLEAAPPLDTLRELRLSWVGWSVQPDDVARLAAMARRLRVLHLESCPEELVPVLRAAAAVEEVSLKGARGGGGLLAALGPASGTLRVLDISCPEFSAHFSPLRSADAEPLAALTGLTRLNYCANDAGCSAIGAVAQLTRLRRLRLWFNPATVDDARLMRLSSLSRLTSLELSVAAHQPPSGAWVAALAAAQVPLQELRLCMGAMLPGHGAEAAVGQLMRLTSLHLAINRNLQASRTTGPLPALQLQLLGCSGAAGSGADGGPVAAGRNTGLQHLSLECNGLLSDDEVAAAAGALPDLRRLSLREYCGAPETDGLHGAGLAAFSACRRLREILLWDCPHLEFQQLVAALPDIGGLACLQLANGPRVDSGSVRRLQAAFRAKQHRDLRVLRDGCHFRS